MTLRVSSAILRIRSWVLHLLLLLRLLSIELSLPVNSLFKLDIVGVGQSIISILLPLPLFGWNRLCMLFLMGGFSN